MTGVGFDEQVVVGVLEDVLDPLLDVDVDDLSDGEVHRAMLAVATLVNRANAMLCHLAEVWDRRDIWREDGSRSASARLSRELGCRRGTTNRVLARAEALVSMPEVYTAFVDGRLSVDLVDEFTRVNTPARRPVFVEHETDLVKACVGLSFWDAERLLRYWANRADAILGLDDGPDPGHEGRTASSYRGIDGQVHIQVIFDAVAGGVFLEAWDRIEHDLYLSDQTTGSTRTGEQRGADALIEMAVRASATGVTSTCGNDQGDSNASGDTNDGPPPTSTQPPSPAPAPAPTGTCTSCGGRSRRPRPLLSVVIGDHSFRRLCELSNGAIVAPAALVPYLGECDVETVLFDGPFHGVGVSTQRSFTGVLRRIIEVRDRNCQHGSGCDTPMNRCDVDHIQTVLDGGTTTQDNGRLLCHRHNRDPAIRNLGPHNITVYDDHHDVLAARARFEAFVREQVQRPPPTAA